MKAKRILSALMSLVMLFTMFVCLTMVVTAPMTASAASATATTKAIYVGPSTRYANNVPSGIFLPIPNLGKYGDGTTAEITAKVKMLSGTKPFVQMMRTATCGKDSTVGESVGSVVFYQADGIGSNWHDNSTSNIDSDGIFHCDIKFKDIPGEGNCFYSSVWDGGTEYRKSNISGRSTPIGCGIFIGNTVLNDDISVYSSHTDLSMEFIISDIHVTLKSISGGDGSVSTGYDLAPSDATLNTAARYFFVGDSKMGNRPDAKNHPLNGRIDQWNICSQDEDTVRQVTVADDIFDGGSHSYTKHNETDYEFEYYTSADFGSDVKFEKIGNCYSRYLDDDVAKKAFIIKSHAGDSKALTSNQGSSTVANIFIPINIHKFYSAYNADTCGSKDLREDGTAIRFGISFKARRISGTGQPVVGVAYADGNANGASGTSFKDAEFGAPREYGKDRSYNNGLEKEGSRTKQSDWVSSSYNASTGEFTALISTESGYYKQMSRDGKSAYISIGLAEHLNSSLESLNTDSTFVISDIKFTVYELNNSSTVKFSGANQAPKMTKANCDVETPYQYGQLWDYNEKVNSVINVGVRNAPINKYSVDGAIQNVFLINSNVCNRSGCTLTHHAATDTTLEYWSCSTHSKNYKDEFASEELANVSATKKMIVVRDTGNTIYGTFIPMDNDGWTGDRYFIFKCKMKVFGDGVPIITGYRAGYWGSIGTFYPGDRTSQAAKDGVATKWVHYDPETCTYTAAFYMWRADPKEYNQFKYYNSTNGAHTAIMLGNFVPTSGQNPGVTANCYTTGFAFTDPEIYEAVDSAAGTYTGDNLCTPVTDKTVDFSTSYKYSACTQLGGSGEWTDRASNTIMNAPLRTWSKYSNTSRVSLSDIPTGYFEGTAKENTLRLSSPSGTSSGVVAVSKETFLDPSTTYQFDVDYRIFGGQSPRIVINVATETDNGGSYTNNGYSALEYDDYTVTSSNIDGSHMSVQFTTPSNIRGHFGGGNFMLQLGILQINDKQKSTTSAYFANAQLRKVDGGDLGPNHLINGDFSFGNSGTDFTIFKTPSYTAEDSVCAAAMPYWDSTANVKQFRNAMLMKTPENELFGSSDATGDSTLAFKALGDSKFGNAVQFKVELEPNTYYRFAYNYRATDDMPELVFGGRGEGNITVTQKSTNSGGKYKMTYELHTNSSVTSYSDTDANVRFILKLGGYSQDNDFYINGVTLYKLTGSNGTTVGGNMVGELNPLLYNSYYTTSAGLNSNGAYCNIIANQDGGDNMAGRFVGVGWFAYNSAGTYSTANAQLVKVPSDFFNYETPSERLSTVRQVVLGQKSSDGINPTYNPNNDSTWGDVKDLVHTKLTAVYHNDSSFNATDSMKQYLLDTVIDVKDDSSGWVSGSAHSYYVSSSIGNDSTGTGKDDAPYATLEKANNMASAGDTIYLKRGDIFYSGTSNNKVSADYAFTLKSGVHYAAYGTGDKPILSGSPKNFSYKTSTSWYEVSGHPNIWKTQFYSGSQTTNANASMIYFYDNQGRLTIGKNIAKPRSDSELLYDYDVDDLDEDLEFYSPYKSNSYDMNPSYCNEAGYLYVYSTSNPSSRFDRIEVAINHTAVVKISKGTGSTELGTTTMNNIAVMYGGVHGVKSESTESPANVKINKCEIAYIGGAANWKTDEEKNVSGWSRLGNGVEFGNGISNATVTNCYVHDCFDAGLTFQSYGSVSTVNFSNISFDHNILEDNTYNIEIFMRWSQGDSMSNIYVDNNILRNAGCGWGTINRNKDAEARCANITFSRKSAYTSGKITNLNIRNNIFDCTKYRHVMWTWASGGSDRHAGLTATGNTFFQRKGAHSSIDSPIVMAYGPIEGSNQNANGRSALVEAVNAFDTAPGGIYWLGDLG